MVFILILVSFLSICLAESVLPSHHNTSSPQVKLGLVLIVASLLCIGTWSTLLRLCTIFTFDNDQNRTKQTKWKKFFGQG